MPLRATPSPLTPSTSPRLGVESQHQGLHRCALDGFLAPPSEPTTPTRILRDQLLLIRLSVGTQTGQLSTSYRPSHPHGEPEEFLLRRNGKGTKSSVFNEPTPEG
jgi:hypothetical protein